MPYFMAPVIILPEGLIVNTGVSGRSRSVDMANVFVSEAKSVEPAKYHCTVVCQNIPHKRTCVILFHVFLAASSLVITGNILI
jgi:hypothetical protein